MTEILTESFCERCGTRYTFESNARRRGFQRVRLLSLGVRHFVENDGSTVKEAMEAARGDLARSASSEQIDAFHRTFSFCMGCRQYTCANCWNAAEGMCLTCAPDLSREVLPAPFPDLPLHPLASREAAAPGEAWPVVEALPPAVEAVSVEEPDGVALAAVVAATEAAEVPATGGEAPAAFAEPTEVQAAERAEPTEVEAVELAEPAEFDAVELAEPAEFEVAATSAEPIAAAAEPAEPGAPVAAASTPTAQAEALTPDELALVAGALAARSAAAHAAGDGPVTGPLERLGEPPDQAAVGRARTRALLGQFRPARPARPPLPEPGGAAASTGAAGSTGVPASRPAATPEGATTPAAEGAPASAPLEAAPGGIPTRAPGVAPAPPAEPRDDIVAQPTWSVVAPDVAAAAAGPAPTPGQPSPAVPPIGSLAPAGPLAPRTPRPMTPRPPPARPPAGAVSPWAARLASSRPETGVWAESSRDVLGEPGPGTPAGIQACVSCGLPLSATARFCRRCGSRQG